MKTYKYICPTCNNKTERNTKAQGLMLCWFCKMKGNSSIMSYIGRK